MDNRKYNLALAAIFETGIILRFWELGRAQLWYDEAFTLLAARLDIPGLIRATASDVHPPLHYLIQWAIIRLFGEQNWAMRMPSALCSVAAMFLMWQLAKRMNISRPAILTALGFMALNPVQLWYAQEARMYPMLQLLVLLQVLFVLDRHWWLLCIVTAIALWLHNYALIYLPVIGVLALWVIWRSEDCAENKRLETVLYGFTGVVIPLALWLPWAFTLASQMKTVAAGYWIEPVNIGTAIYDLQGIWWGIIHKAPFDSIAVLVFAGLFAFTLIRSAQRREHGVLLWVALAPLLLATTASIVWKPMLLFRGLIGSVPALTLVVAEVLAGQRQTALNRSIAALIILPVILAGQVTYWANHATSKGMDHYIVDAHIRPEWQPGDVLIHLNDGTGIMLSALVIDLPQFEMDSPCNPPIGAITAETREAVGIQKISLAAADEQYHRVWLIGGVGSTSNRCEEELLHTLSSGGKPMYLETSDLIMAGVWLYEDGQFKE